MGHLQGSTRTPSPQRRCLSHFLLRDGSEVAILERALKAKNIILTSQLRSPHSLMDNKRVKLPARPHTVLDFNHKMAGVGGRFSTA